MEDLYSENEDFKEFVDKYAKTRGVSVDVALTHKTVKDVGEYYNGLKQDGIGVIYGKENS